MKVKLLVILGIISFSFFTIGITYSAFNTESYMCTNQNIAGFIFETNNLEEINLEMSDIKPGDTKNYEFSVANNQDENKSDVTISYQMTIRTYHFIPLNIKLYDGDDVLVLDCDETYSRNDDNELVCNTLIEEMDFSSDVTHSYRLEVEFPSEYDDVIYSSLVDFIDIEIKSWQK